MGAGLLYSIVRLLVDLVATNRADRAQLLAEVMVLSTLFAISQLDKFGNGLIKSGCVSCYVVDATLLSNFGVYIAAAVTYMVAAIWLFCVMHPVVFHGRLREVESSE